MVCEEYLDVINVVVRDAYYYTYPRTISAEGYIKSFGRHGTPGPSYDEVWRRQVMERAFKRMVNKDKILTSKQSEWELHPDFDAKRFFKVRDSAEWVSQIYSTITPQQHRSRVALQSLESFLDYDLGPISGKQLIKLFGYSAGEGYEYWQNEHKKVVKPEPAPELIDPTQISSMAGTKRKRIEIEGDGSDEHNSSGSEPSSPIPLFTPISSPPSLQSARSSFDVNKPLDISETVIEKSRRETFGVTQPEKSILERQSQEAREDGRSGSTIIEKPRQEAHVAAQPGRTVVENLRPESGATPPERAIPEKSMQNLHVDAQPGRATERQSQEAHVVAQSRDTVIEKPQQAASASTQAEAESSELQNLLSQYPWLVSAPRRIQEKFPQDSFELVVSEGTLKFKCHDCPTNLYKAVYPDRKICNFEAHLRTPAHRRNVTARLSGVTPVVGQASLALPRQSMNSRVIGVAPVVAQPSPTIHRQSFNSRSSGVASMVQQPSPALHRPDIIPRPNRRSSVARQASFNHDQEADSDQQSANEGRSLIMIFPIRRLLNAANSRKRSLLSESSQPEPELSDNDDIAKRRRLDSEGRTYSTNPHTVKARARVANLDPRTKQYELLQANDKKMAKYHVENVVKRSEAYQRASSAERPALVEQGRNEYVNARRKLGRDAESYARSQGGYNKLTKEWGLSEERFPAATSDMRGLRRLDIAAQGRDSTTGETQDNLGAATKADFGTALSKYRISQASEEVARSPTEQEASRPPLEHQKWNASDDEFESRIEAGMELESRIKVSESSGFNNMALGEKQASLSGLLSLLEKRTETQRQNFTAAHQLQVSTSEEIALLRTTSNRHDQELEAFKSTTKREKEWRKYLDKLTKEHKTKIEQLEAKVRREREDKQNFKMATEGRVDAMIKHHQTSSDAMMKKMSALEKLVMEQSKQIEMLTSVLSTQKEMAQSSWVEAKPMKESARSSLSKGGSTAPLRPAWAM